MTIKNLRSLSNLRKLLLSKGLNANTNQIKKLDDILKKYRHLFVITEEEIQTLINQFISSHKEFSSRVSYGQYGLGQKRIRVLNTTKQYDFYVQSYNDFHDMSYLLIQPNYKISEISFINQYPEFEDTLWNYLEIKLKRDQQLTTELLTKKELTTEEKNKTSLLSELIERKSKENQALKTQDDGSKKINNNSLEIADALIELCQIDEEVEFN